MARDDNPRGTLSFVLIASMLMVIVDHFFFPVPKHHPGPRTPDIQEKIYEHSETADYETGQAITHPEKEIPVKVVDLHEGIPQPEPIKNNAESLAKIIREPAGMNIEKNIIKPPPAPVALPPITKGKGFVVVIIDDMGMDRKRSRQILDLPGPLTVSFLPYAPQLQSIVDDAKANGHELLIHVPMQPLDSHLDPGPLVLRDDMSDDALKAALEHSFNSFTGYVGINNHMGSRVTQNRRAMDVVMEALKARDLLFVDSKTIPTSVAADAAAAHGLSYAERDIFLDNVNDKAEVMENLEKLEALAKRRGYAIAIGHPREATIESLKEWLPTLKKRGLTLVPVSRVVHRAKISMVSYPLEPFGPARAPVPQP